ncbi:oligopeptide ABC transporter ATP-binding protein [Firmicutes bacterium CAG:449]|nr:oligopeptide ABC transporter ATP-binding protein [Firmicutes bacterium CAG:449]
MILYKNFLLLLAKEDAAGTTNKISGYSTSNEKVKENNKSFDYEHGEVILDVRHLKQFFRFGKGEYKYNKAVNNVSFQVYKGEVFGLVGESGCGKTTTGRSIIKLYQITSGDVWFKGVRIAAGTRWNEKEIKYTKLRLKEALRKNKLNKNTELSALNLEYQDAFNEKFEIKKVHDEIERKISDVYEQKIPFVDKYDEIVNKYNILDHEEIDKATRIVNEQRKKIALAKHDNKCCDKDISQAEIKKVREKYSDGKLTEEQFKEEMNKAKHASITSKIQMIFQDPIASLNPRMTVRNIIAEGLVIKGIKDEAYITSEVNRVLELVGLLPEHANRYPHEFSGGQRQRIGIARAIVMNPELIIADEPVSALDVSIQAQVINLLNDLRNNLGLTILFIAHNLSVVKYFCDRIAVMYFGNLVELATSEELFAHPLHPYTKSLLSAVPHPDPNIEKNRQRIVYNASAEHDYSINKPTMREISKGHFVFCNDEEEKKYKAELKKEVKNVK